MHSAVPEAWVQADAVFVSRLPRPRSAGLARVGARLQPGRAGGREIRQIDRAAAVTRRDDAACPEDAVHGRRADLDDGERLSLGGEGRDEQRARENREIE